MTQSAFQTTRFRLLSLLISAPLLVGCAEQNALLDEIWFDAFADSSSAYFSYQTTDPEFATRRKASLAMAKSRLEKKLARKLDQYNGSPAKMSQFLRDHDFQCNDFFPAREEEGDILLACKILHSAGPIQLISFGPPERPFQPLEWSVILTGESSRTALFVDVTDLAANYYKTLK